MPGEPVGVTGEFRATVWYTCSRDDWALLLNVLAGFRSDGIVLLLPGEETWQQHRLYPVRSASGARFETDGLMFWTKEDEAMLDAPRYPDFQCRAVGEPDTWQRAALRGAHFRATGNEPGWYLEAFGERVHLVADYGNTVATAPSAAWSKRADEWRLSTTADTNRITVTARDRPCTDSMNGRNFPLTVTVELHGHRNYCGCGMWLLERPLR